MDEPKGLPERTKQYSWFRILTVVVPFLLLFVLLAWWFVPQGSLWTPWQTPLGKAGGAARVSPWVDKDREAELRHRIERIDEQIPALIGETQWLATKLKNEEAAKDQNRQDVKEYTDFIRRETNFVQQHIDNLQADTALLPPRAARAVIAACGVAPSGSRFHTDSPRMLPRLQPRLREPLPVGANHAALAYVTFLSSHLRWSPPSPRPRAKTKRPNIVFIFRRRPAGRHHRRSRQHAHRTPNLDRLVRRGTAFTHAYCMCSLQGAVCVPSCAMVLSGRSLFHVNEISRA